MLFGVDAPCPTELTFDSVRIDEQHTAEDKQTMASVFSRLDCIDTILSPSDAVRLHGMNAVLKMEAGDAGGVTLAVLAARSIPLPGPLPQWLMGTDTALPVPAPWGSLVLPDGIALFVDGTPARGRPLDRPAVYQAVGAGGTVLWTKYLAGSEELPKGFVLGEPPPPQDAELPSEKIALLKELLLDARYEEVLLEAVSLSARFPEYAETFRSIAAIAREQQLLSIEESAKRVQPLYRLTDKSQRWPYRTDERRGILVGFEVGAPSGVRIDWKFSGQIVDSIGLRVGVGAHWDYLSTLSDSIIADLIIIDFNLSREWQLETTVGLNTVSSSVMPTIGLAAQWDPSNPLQVTMGASIDPYGIAPRASVGFMW